MPAALRDFVGTSCRLTMFESLLDEECFSTIRGVQQIPAALKVVAQYP